MRNLTKLFVGITLVAIIGFLMAACDNNIAPQTVTYSGTANGKMYTLKITENKSRAAYTPQSGDSYELTVGTEISKGTVVSFINGTLILKPYVEEAEQFTATVSSSDITSIKGKITFINGKKEEAPTIGITIGNWTYSVEDDSYLEGTSSITMTRGTGADSNKLTFSGNLTNDVGNYGYGGYGYCNIYVQPNETELTKLRTASSISFKAKGNGKKFELTLAQSDITDSSYYTYYFTPTSSETTFTIDISDLAPAYWGQSSQGTLFDQSKVYLIRFERNGAHTNEYGPFNITISDLTLNND